ncbi:acyltransferase [Desulfosporosinus sp. BG]|uniref:acyltransferase family protein n=1 Tax=Desulfosporosinus sp. BG TaxID=1633135 RepID=UPI000839F111|nr:acyltransferase [Desulfosporosinus sp. BG]ODA39132.1 Transmembrane protein [Desulfosporosinus sp. BG]
MLKGNYNLKSRAVGFDCLKCVCVFLIVCIHQPFLGEIGAYFTALTRIAVPVFFMITGYFYSVTVRKRHTNNQIIKIIKLTIGANVFYFVWEGCLALLRGNPSYFEEVSNIKVLIKFLVLNVSPFEGHLWYLSAILYVLIIVKLVDRFWNRKVLWPFIPVLLIGDLCLGKYSLLLFGREFPYTWVRNFLFVGIPYFCLGDLIYQRRDRIAMIFTKRKNLLLSLIAVIALLNIGERFILVSTNVNATRDHYICTTFLALLVFILAQQSKVTDQNKVVDILSTIGRKYSMLIYVIHPAFITCFNLTIRKVVSRIQILNSMYQVIAPMLVFIVALAFAFAYEKIVRQRRIYLKRN